jgi:uncharacterized protein (TIGR02246 family)
VELAMRIFLTLFAMTWLTACTGMGGVNADENAAIERATDAWRAAYDSRDPQRIGSQYAPDAVFWGTGSKVVRATPEAIAEYFKDAAARPDARVAFGEHHIRVYGNVAFNTGYYTFSDVRDGKRVPSAARFSLGFHKREGKWILVNHHSSRMP